jgi:hypothetical protein
VCGCDSHKQEGKTERTEKQKNRVRRTAIKKRVRMMMMMMMLERFKRRGDYTVK